MVRGRASKSKPINGRDAGRGRAAREGEDAARLEHQRLAHEAEVHQLELEMQNRALREAHGELEMSLARYAELYEFAPVAHLTVDAFGTIRKVNLACASLLGRESTQLEGLPARVLLQPTSRPDFETHLRASLTSRDSRSVELSVLLPDGQKRPVELVTVPRPAYGASTEKIVYHSTLTDMSGRRQSDDRRDELLRRERDARLMADSANQVKEDFLAIVAHELRTPLAPLLLWLRALRLGGGEPSLRARALAAIETGVKAHLAMIDDLVDVEKGRHGHLRLERSPLDLRPVVTAAVESLAPSAAAKLISLEVSIPDEPGCVSGDFSRLRQVVTNLLSNALKFTPDGGHVAIAVSLAGDEVLLTVSDDGEGLEPELLEEVFEPFRQREKAAATRHGGLGLGLAIVRQIVTEHGGVVHAESAGRGKGCSFTVKLPRIEISKSLAVHAPKAPVELTWKSGVLQGVRVLVVEDHPDTREALGVILEACGARVQAVESPLEAWALAFASPRPNVVVSDIGLPGEDGHSFLRRLRSQELENGHPRVAAIALTALAAPRDRARALLAGFDRHVSKPIAFDVLIGSISSLLRSREASVDRTLPTVSDSGQT